MALHPKDDRLFVACASSNCVSRDRHPARDRHRDDLTRPCSRRLPKAARPTPWPSARRQDALRRQRRQQLRRRHRHRDSQPRARSRASSPPAGIRPPWPSRPTARHLLVGVGKGNQTQAQPDYTKERAAEEQTERPDRRSWPPAVPVHRHDALGSLSIVPVPDEKTLGGLHRPVYRNCPYSDKLLTGAPYPEKTAIPTKVGDPSPIKHVLYIIKENRTYDQVFGDITRGQRRPGAGDVRRERDAQPPQAGRGVRPARQPVLQRSRLGRRPPWSTMAYNTDYIARNWALTYSRRNGHRRRRRGRPVERPLGLSLGRLRAGRPVAIAAMASTAGASASPTGRSGWKAACPAWSATCAPDYGIPKRKGERIRDTDNAETSSRSSTSSRRTDNLPRFMVMSLGEDHTDRHPARHVHPAGLRGQQRPGAGPDGRGESARASLWPETAIFVIEDDAQNGPDHVDAHRTVGLVISPYTKRKYLDSTQYSTVSMIRTIELILGLPPLSQYDAAARPMFASFTDKADLTPLYKHEPAQIDLNAVNDQHAPTAPSGRARWTSPSTTGSTTSSSTRSSGARSRARMRRCRRPCAGRSPSDR